MGPANDFYNLLLNVSVFLPLVGALLILPAGVRHAKTIALVVSLATLGVSLWVFGGYLQYANPAIETGDFAFKKAYYWLGYSSPQGFVAPFDVKFITGLDGVSVYLYLLTALLFPLSIFFSWNSIDKLEKPYYILLLLLQTGVTGVFVALDLIMFYIFFEVGLIPMYFLIGIWGGKDRIYAAVKFFLYTLVGSLLMFVAILYLGFASADAVAVKTEQSLSFTSDFYLILKHYAVPENLQRWLFWGFLISFAIKVPLFPFHTWLPDAHVQAPTAGSVLLAGVLLKLGTYGIVRFCLPLFPDASFAYAPTMAFLGLIGVIYGAMTAMVQTDVKKLVAYSSVAHMGFVVMGIFAMTEEAMSGAILQMINHGISTGGLFFLVGMVYDRRHTREIADYQGVAKVMPAFTLLFMITTLSSIGLPGLNGFVGEFLILLGSFKSPAFSGAFAVLAATGVIIAAVYMLWMFRRVFFGELDKKENQELTDLTSSEVLTMIPLVILMFVVGFYASPFLEHIGKSSDPIVQTVVKAVGASASVP
ncbi:MAG: NADH-quinone oxidoreductase subunit M [Bacteroidia bacterium]|nr:NADH-quinone oxidoreductase subunit M [Bacteroidia bacterium]